MNICRDCEWVRTNDLFLPWKCRKNPSVSAPAYIDPVYGDLIPERLNEKTCRDKNPKGSCQDYEPKEDQA